MATFNAGAIEGTLTLDRSPFNREMKAAQAQARRFEARKINPELRLKGADQLFEAEAMLKALDSQKIEIPLDIDDGGDLATAATIINNLDGKDIDLKIDVDGYAELAAVQAAITALDGQDIDIDVDVNGGEMAMAFAAQGTAHFGRMQAIVTAILVLLPLIPPMVATIGAALVGLASGLTAAAGAVTVLGLGVAPTIMGMMELNEELGKQRTRLAGLEPGSKAYINQQKKINQLQKEMRTRFGEASDGMVYLQKKWDEFGQATGPKANGLIGGFLRMIGDILPTLVPVFNAAAPVIEGMFKSMGDFMKSGEGDRMIKFFTEFGSESLSDILSIGGNLLQFLGRLFEAFAPFGGDLLEDIDALTQSWADWADGIGKSQGFQDFIAYVNEEGPKVWDLIKSFIGALINFGEALAPLGSVALDAFTGMFDFIKDMDPSLLGAISVGIGGAALAILLVVGAMAALNAVLAINPFVLLGIAIAAIIGGLIYLWNTNDGFRDAIISAWDSIMSFLQPVFDWFTGTAVPAMVEAWDNIVVAAKAVWEEVSPIVSMLAETIGLYFTLIWTIISGVFNAVVGVVKWAWNAIFGESTGKASGIASVIGSVFGVIQAIFSTVFNVIVVIVQTAWNIIKTVIMTVLRVIQGVIKAALAVLRGDWDGAWNQIFGIVSAIWKGITGVISAAINGMKGIFSAGMNGVRNVASSIWGAIKTVFSTGVSNIKSIVTGIPGMITGALSGAKTLLLSAGRNIIQGFIDGIGQMKDAAVGKMQDVMSGVRDLLPFSPAKKGPFSGKGWTLYSGMALIDGAIQGIRNRKDAFADTMADALKVAQPGAVNIAVPEIQRSNAYGNDPTRSVEEFAARVTSAIQALADRLGVSEESARRMVLRIGDREFEAFLDEYSDERDGRKTDILRTGRKS